MDVDLRKANELFHDVESSRYDYKWGIQYDEGSAQRVRHKFEKLLKRPFPHVEKMLEVGCGTGYIGLNLCLSDGLVGELYACDISKGMVETCVRNAQELGVEVVAKQCQLEELDYWSEQFDMVIGHAILHHIPDIDGALAEIYRVLRPGGICMLAGEPTRMGDIIGRVARRGTVTAVKAYVGLGGRFGGGRARLRPHAPPAKDDETSRFEQVVDIHTFKPADVCRAARSVGFAEARFETEELLSSFVGWITRTIENTLSEENLTWAWRNWCYHTYLKLNDIDEKIYPYLPPSVFYNMLLYLRKPG